MSCRALGGLVLAAALVGCTKFEPDFTVRAGVESATVTDGVPGEQYTLYDADDNALLTLVADEAGQAHFAYLPRDYATVETGVGAEFPFSDGDVVPPGDDYEVRIDGTESVERSGRFRVLAVDDVADAEFYASQTLTGMPFSPLEGPLGELEQGFQYLEMRDGVLLSAMVRFPDPLFYGEGPWPTVIEYSGYSPSRPDDPDNGTRIANAMGFATVSVNMRGSGCSGGVFDVFNRAQHADGYDIVEIVATQSWVLNNQVGMVGLSYPGIAQLYVASTNPPSLAAVVPLSTIADAWEMQWPGGIYNQGFTRQWVEQREADAAAGGKSWVVDQIASGDETCAANVGLSSQNIDFESFLRSLEFRPDHANDRDLNLLVEQIEAPVFLGGQWQDEQTGAQFGGMLDRFDHSRSTRFVLSNGRHPDGYAPDNVFRWYEFLEFYVSERVPEVHPAIRLAGAAELGKTFGLEGYRFPAERWGDFDGDYAGALAAYEAEPDVLVLFENGAGAAKPGVPVERSTATFEAWPPAEAQERTWYLDSFGALSDAPTDARMDRFRFDADAGAETFFGDRGYELLTPLWDLDWTQFAQGDAVSYLTEPFAEDAVVAGPGIATLFFRSPVDDLTVQVTLTEVRPDGIEVFVQSGWLRLGHRAAAATADLRLDRSYAEADFEPVPIDTEFSADVEIPSFAHPIRAGSQLRLIVSAPGRDHGTWEFEAPVGAHDAEVGLVRGGDYPSALTLTLLPDVDLADGLPPCPSLRGQPCRDYQPTANRPPE